MAKPISARMIDLYMTIIGYIDLDPEIKNEEIGYRLNLGTETVSNYKCAIKKRGWLISNGIKGAPYYLTDESRTIFEEYNCERRVIMKSEITRKERVKDRRMSVLGYLSFDFKFTLKDIADILKVGKYAINNDVKFLKEKGLITELVKVSKLGLETLDNYKCDLY